MEIRWARSATKHRINRSRSEHAIRHAIAVIEQPAPEDSSRTDERLLFLGPDQDEVMLEVLAIETTTGLLVIHAMRMRTKYRDHLEGGSDEET